MAAVAASRRHGYVQGRPPRGSGRIRVERRATATYQGHPIPRAVLQEFLDALPDEAMVEVTPTMGGSQRDPETVGYRLAASW